MPQRLIDAVNAYDNLRKVNYLFSLRYSKKSKFYYDQNFLLRFDKESFRHLILGTKHLDNDHYIEHNSKLLYDELFGLTVATGRQNAEFQKIVTDPNYPDIINRLENIVKMDSLLRSRSIKIYHKSASPAVLTKKIPFEFLLKMDSYGGYTDTPFLFVELDSKYQGLTVVPTSTFRSDKPYEQNHKYREVASLDVTELLYRIF